MATNIGSLKKIIFISLCLSCFAPAFAQENKLLFQNLSEDSLMARKAKIIDSTAYALTNSNPDSSLLLGRIALKVADQAKSARCYAMALNTIGWAHFHLGHKDSAIWYIASAKTMYHDLHQSLMESRMLMNLSSVYETESDYPQALQNLSASVKLADMNKDSITLLVAEKTIGIIYRKQGHFDQAKIYLQRAVQIAAAQKKAQYYADALSSLASLYLQMSSFDTARVLYHKSLIIYKSINDICGVALVNENLGLCFENMGNAQALNSAHIQYAHAPDSNHMSHAQALDSAIVYYQRAYDINMQLNNKYDAAYEKLLISDIFTIKKNYKLAEKNLKESLPVFDSMHVVSEEYSGYQALSVLYDSMHDYKNAYKAILKANVYYDTINQQEKNKAIADMLVKYEANKKDTTIALLNARSELAEHKLSRTRIIEFFSILLIVLIALLTLLLLNRNNIKQRFKQLQMRNQIASDLHDEVGSSLSSILMLGKIALTEQNGRDEIINKINSNAEEMIERISDIVWATNPKYDDGKNLKEKISNYILQVNKLSKHAVNLSISDEIAGIKFQMDVRRNVFLIIKEAINNILKHARASVITIAIYIDQKKLHIRVTDNGIGFDVQHHNDGNGLENMKTRTENVGGIFKLTSEKMKGTQITVMIPL